MSIFCYKKLEAPKRICFLIKNARIEKGLTIEQAEEKTRVPKKYLEAIEECKFNLLPKAKSHRIAYIKKYCELLELDEHQYLTKFFEQEGLEDIDQVHPHTEVDKLYQKSISIWARNIIIVLTVVCFALYLIWQIRGVLQPPKLEVYFPQDGYVSETSHIKIEGFTEKETHITINGKEIKPDEQGNFQAEIDLTKGINTINIIASKKHGKQNNIIRNIIVK